MHIIDLDRIVQSIRKEQKLTMEMHQTLPKMILKSFRFVISNLPSQYDVGCLVPIITKVTRMENAVHFIVTAEKDSTALVTFKKKLSEQGTHIIVVNSQ